ncbi:hypothetical protein B0T25DRAFT_599088 [Lasiosphaeria hispida]|uniref:DUF6594 domain-containing protein n=1 Tax=Lasiosphaeria hispida TaxID=260671 RepID=A0AAJ0HXI9_9PEZI|nr:hypothetical protein B0T25DRAFT_599088 [Lasiosphaeria hispida]
MATGVAENYEKGSNQPRDVPVSLGGNTRPHWDNSNRPVDMLESSRGGICNWDDETLKIEFFHRYNILWSRYKLLQHSEQDFFDTTAPETVLKDLSAYSNALRDYRFFRNEGESLFATKRLLGEVAKEIGALDGARSKLALLEEDSEEAKRLGEEIEQITKQTGEAFLEAMNQAISDIAREKMGKARKALWSRLMAALGGGFALVGPVVIVVLHPTKLTALVTTSCFVILAAVGLATVMKESQPKDVVACTAAYAAVLVLVVVLANVAIVDPCQPLARRTSVK